MEDMIMLIKFHAYNYNLETRKNNALKGTGLFTSYNVSKDF